MKKYTKKQESVDVFVFPDNGKQGECSFEILPYGDVDGTCTKCGFPLRNHGKRMIGILDFFDTICPETYIVVRGDGQIQYLSESEFAEQYELKA